MAVFLALVFFDVATVAYWHVQEAVLPHLSPLPDRSAPVDRIWYNAQKLGNDGWVDDTHWQLMAGTLLTLRQWAELQKAGLTYQSYASTYLYPRVVVGGLKEGLAARARSIPPTVVVDRLPARDQELLRSGGVDTDVAPLNGQVTMTRQSYNSTSFRVTVDRPAGLFWRDAYFKGWTVRVKGERGDVLRAFNDFKAVVVPAGTSVVEFTFLPVATSRALTLSYVQLIIVCGAVYCWLIPDSRKPPWN